ncbi:hypothetical protein GCM10009799_36850 [Nocardiopsis rhodophaea]|uniref:Uncharacterized protein n=1 Tax=Nocardiopsis rhodophaea TaxID=280238 RepID=A0ABP5ETJ4_9ACTN
MAAERFPQVITDIEKPIRYRPILRPPRRAAPEKRTLRLSDLGDLQKAPRKVLQIGQTAADCRLFCQACWKPGNGSLVSGGAVWKARRRGPVTLTAKTANDKHAPRAFDLHPSLWPDYRT